MSESEKMEHDILRSGWASEKSRKEFNDLITELYGKEGREMVLRLWREKHFYISPWGLVRTTTKGWNRFRALEEKIYPSRKVEEDE